MALTAALMSVAAGSGASYSFWYTSKKADSPYFALQKTLDVWLWLCKVQCFTCVSGALCQDRIWTPTDVSSNSNSWKRRTPDELRLIPCSETINFFLISFQQGAYVSVQVC